MNPSKNPSSPPFPLAHPRHPRRTIRPARPRPGTSRLALRASTTGVVRPKPARPQQQQLLEAMTKGRFEKCEPTYYKGEDLDIPTVHRRRTVLN